MRLAVLAFLAFLQVKPFSAPTPCPTPTPIPWSPPPCGASYSPVLSAEVVLSTYAFTVTYTATWKDLPEAGIISDNSIPVRSATVMMGEPVVFVYGRGSVTEKQFGFLSVYRVDGSRCDVRFDFEIPRTSRRPR